MVFNLFASILAAMLVTNIVLQGFGLEVVTSKNIRIKQTLINTALVSVIALVVFLLDYVIYAFVLVPVGAQYFNLLIIATLAILVNEGYAYLVKKTNLPLPSHSIMGLQSMILVAGLILSNQSSFGEAFLMAFGTMLGYIGFAVIFTTIASRMRVAPVSKAFKGLPIALIILGLIALVLTGLSGLF